jgi:ABC-type multidrug transport system permease subunit
MAIVGFLLLAFSSWIGPFLDSWLPRWTALLPSLLLFVGLGVHFLCVPEEKEP